LKFSPLGNQRGFHHFAMNWLCNLEQPELGAEGEPLCVMFIVISYFFLWGYCQESAPNLLAQY
jgi:hypothetical protein